MSSISISEKTLVSLMPKGEMAWSGLSSGIQREIISGIALQAERDKLAGKKIIDDFFPSTTELLTEWEEVYKLPSGELLTDEQRKARLDAVWQRISPATFDGMNKIYELSLLDLIARPLEPGEDPRLIAEQGTTITVYDTVTGLNTVTGSDTLCGAVSQIIPDQMPLIMADGRPGTPSPNYITVCASARCGQLSESSRCGSFSGQRLDPFTPTIPDDTEYWSMIYIIEDESGDFAHIPIELEDAFKFLTYKNKPNFMWAIARVQFVDS